jgi:hypothetical protein
MPSQCLALHTAHCAAPGDHKNNFGSEPSNAHNTHSHETLCQLQLLLLCTSITAMQMPSAWGPHASCCTAVSAISSLSCPSAYCAKNMLQHTNIALSYCGSSPVLEITTTKKMLLYPLQLVSSGCR